MLGRRPKVDVVDKITKKFEANTAKGRSHSPPGLPLKETYLR
jgi:hypothetical protein